MQHNTNQKTSSVFVNIGARQNFDPTQDINQHPTGIVCIKNLTPESITFLQQFEKSDPVCKIIELDKNVNPPQITTYETLDAFIQGVYFPNNRQCSFEKKACNDIYTEDAAYTIASLTYPEFKKLQEVMEEKYTVKIKTLNCAGKSYYDNMQAFIDKNPQFKTNDKVELGTKKSNTRIISVQSITDNKVPVNESEKPKIKILSVNGEGPIDDNKVPVNKSEKPKKIILLPVKNNEPVNPVDSKPVNEQPKITNNQNQQNSVKTNPEHQPSTNNSQSWRSQKWFGLYTLLIRIIGWSRHNDKSTNHIQ
jgi:hypothetical protein